MNRKAIFNEISKGLAATLVIFVDPGNAAQDRVFWPELDGD